MAKEKTSLLGKVGRYGASRVMPEVVRDASRNVISSGSSAAIDAVRPDQVDPADLQAGFAGRYADGGRQRFEEMVASAGLEEADLDRLRAAHDLRFKVSTATSAAFMLGSVILLLIGKGMLAFLGAMICLIFMLGAAVHAVQSDFASFQIRKRAFCGLRSYLQEGFFGR